MATCPDKGVFIVNYFLSLIIDPIIVGIIVGIANKLFSCLLDKKNNNKK